MQLMAFKAMLLLVILFGPAFVISYIMATRYRRQILKTFPFLKGYVAQAIFILCMFLAVFTYFPALSRMLLFRP